MAKSKAEEKVVRLSWSAAANQVVAAINSKTTLAKLAEEADALVVQHGGTSKLATATHHVRRALETAEAMGMLELTRPTDVLVSKVKK